MTWAIETRGLTKTYGATTAVNDLDLRVEAGQVYAFLGPNGAGKSTTIRMLLGLQRPSAGSAKVVGYDARDESEEVHRRVGYLPGDLELFPRLDGARHLEWFAQMRGDIDPKYVDELVERLGVVVDRPVRDLSKGNRQKIGLVLAFMGRPPLLILDEPTTGLDPLVQNEFEGMVRDAVAQGRTVFLSSHELAEVQRLADRVAIIKDGRLLVDDTVEGLGRNVPRRLELRFRHAPPADSFSGLDGVRVTGREGTRVTMEVGGELAPVLRVVADLEPIELEARSVDLDELFLSYYRSDAPRGVGGEG